MPRPTISHPSRLALLRAKFVAFWRSLFGRINRSFSRHPLISFIVALLILLALIALGNFLSTTKPVDETKSGAPKAVQVYNIGQAPKVTLQALVEKSGVITIVAQTGGIVSDIKFQAGDNIKRGNVLVALANNYQGGNSLSIARAIAQKQNQQTQDTYETQKDLINKQRDIANKSELSAEKLREISRASNADTSAQIGLSSDIMNTLFTNLNQYEATNSAGTNDQLILQTKELASQFQGGILQLRTMQRQLDYTTDESQAPAQIASIQRDFALKQLDLQQKSLDLGREISKLQLNLAYVNESMMYPSAPCDGVVQRVFVRVGQSVAPGTPLMTISTNSGHISAIAKAPLSLAKSVSGLEQSRLNLGEVSFSAYPSFVATEATDGQLYAITYDIPDEFTDKLTDKGYINVEVPVGSVNTSAAIPFVPLDAVFQTQTAAYVYVIDQNHAVSRPVKLGTVMGQFVQIIEGLNSGDQIILNRNVITGDPVSAQ